MSRHHCNNRRINRPTCGRICRAAILPLVCLVSLVAAGADPKISTFALDNLPLTPQEHYVLEQVAVGNVADLKDTFGQEENQRIIRARFLEHLITGGFDQIKLSHCRVRLVHAIIDGPLNLEEAEIPGAVSLKFCEFRDNVKFEGCVCRKMLVLDHSIFLADVNFRRLHVERAFLARYAIFHGEVDFRSATVSGVFHLNRARFEKNANFSSLKVGHHAFLRGILFKGPVLFRSGHVDGRLAMEGSIFDQKADFSDTSVGHGVFMRDFSPSRETEPPYKPTEFKESVSFLNADIKGQFDASGAQFHQGAQFGGLNVGKAVLFRKVSCSGPLKIHHACLGGLELAQQNSAPTIPLLQLHNSKIQGKLKISGIQLDNLEAHHLLVRGETVFEKVTIHKKADFSYSSFQSLDLLEIAWPQEKDRVWLDGLTYTNISAGKNNNGSEDWEKLFALIEFSRFNPFNYSKLETYLVQLGNQEQANQIYILGNQRDLARQGWGNPVTWVTWLFWDKLAGYGRKPLRILWVAIAIILLGAWFSFDPRFLKFEPVQKWSGLVPDLEADTPNDKATSMKTLRQRVGDKKFIMFIVLKFMISLDHFIPGVDLGLEKNWHPSELSYSTWLYIHFQKLSGWVLVPIAIAALYTKFKSS